MKHPISPVLKVAIVHDYIKEYGGAERVLSTLLEIYPQAYIYTAFCDKNSEAFKRLKSKKIITSWFNLIPFSTKLASPLRFLTPFIWSSFARPLADYDVVISSASWYIAKGFGSRQNKPQHQKLKSKKPPIEICYCHTPPRWLYGYETSINYKKHFFIRIYAYIIGHFLRLYDFSQAQKVNYFIANSNEVAGRIRKFYKRDSKVIYPPVSIYPNLKEIKKEDYYFIVSRIVGAKGIELAIDTALRMGIKLKIAGSPAGYFNFEDLLKKAQGKIEFLGQVTDKELASLYSGAKGFLALSKDEDFGITPVEAMMCKTAVIAFNGGGYKETVLDNKTGILFNDYSIEGLAAAIRKFEKTKFNKEDIRKHAQKFSKEIFMREIKNFVASKS